MNRIEKVGTTEIDEKGHITFTGYTFIGSLDYDETSIYELALRHLLKIVQSELDKFNND